MSDPTRHPPAVPGGPARPTPPPGAPPGVPVPSAPVALEPLDRAAVERVLARAAELQAGSADPTGLLTEEQIVEIGREVGLSGEVLRQALAEERTRTLVPVESGTAARLFGPRSASASRTVRGSQERTLALIDGWMQRDECLQTKRRFPDRVTWEARRDLAGSLRRGLNLGGRGYALARAHEVAATVVPVDAGRVLVRLDADLSSSRDARVRASGAAAATGVATGGALAAVATMVVVPGIAAAAAVASLAALPALVGFGAAWAVARSHADTVTRTQLALDQLLDRLEFEQGAPTAPAGLAGVAAGLLGKLW